MTEWVFTIAKALYLLDGKAHSSDIAAKCLELGEQNPQLNLEATVRDALQRYSSMSAKGKKKDINPGTPQDVFHSEPEKRNSIFWISSDDNSIVKYIIGKIDREQFKDDLQNSTADASSIEKLIAATYDERTIFVREHWRSPPCEAENPENDFLDLGLPRFEPIGAWCTRTKLEIELKSNVIIRVPLWWFPRLLNANQRQRSNLELSPFGIHWPDIDEDISVIGLLRGDKAPGAEPPGRAEA